MLSKVEDAGFDVDSDAETPLYPKCGPDEPQLPVAPDVPPTGSVPLTIMIVGDSIS